MSNSNTFTKKIKILLYIIMKFNSRIATNSFATQEAAMAFPFKNGGSFGGLSKPQYSHLIYHQLADNSTGFGSRGARWERNNGIRPISFIPPVSIRR
jgi:hypothetical protein